MPLRSGAKDGEPTHGLGSEGVDLFSSYGCPRDPRATFLGYNGKPEGSKGVNPKFPNFGKFRSGTANDRVTNVCKDVDGKRGKVGSVTNFTFEGGYGRVQEEAEEGRGQTLSLEHAINNVKGIKKLLASWHVKGAWLVAQKRAQDMREGGHLLTNAVNNEGTRSVAKCIFDIGRSKHHRVGFIGYG